MYRDVQPAWHRDVKWISGILLAVTLAAATLLFSLAQITERERAEPLLREVLELTLLPGAEDEQTVTVRRGIEWTAGEPLQLLPGVDVFADPTELPDFSAEDAVSRIAGVLADRTIRDGTEGARALVSAPQFGAQLAQAFERTVPRLTYALLADAMLPAGLADGSRFANWPLQAVQNPGEPVQPVVGVFVFIDPNRLQASSTREIAELVVTRLSERVLGQGLAAADEAITNVTLQQILVQTVEGEVRNALHELFSTLLVPWRDELASRLEQTRAVLAGAEAPEADGLLGLIPAEELAGMEPDEVNEQVLATLASRVYDDGGAGVLSVLTETDQAARVASVTPLLDALTERAHGRYVRWTWFTGVASLIFLALLVGFSKGTARLVNPGLAIAIAAAGGSLLFTRLAAGLGSLGVVGLPVSVRSEGFFAHLFGLLAYLGTNLPRDAVPLLVRNHLIVLAVGAGLLVLALLVRFVGFLRPRRRSLL